MASLEVMIIGKSSDERLVYEKGRYVEIHEVWNKLTCKTCGRSTDKMYTITVIWSQNWNKRYNIANYCFQYYCAKCYLDERAYILSHKGEMEPQAEQSLASSFKGSLKFL